MTTRLVKPIRKIRFNRRPCERVIFRRRQHELECDFVRCAAHRRRRLIPAFRVVNAEMENPVLFVLNRFYTVRSVIKLRNIINNKVQYTCA